jgi:stearoyl-CoA desaturase (delta-9 desaturase)
MAVSQAIPTRYWKVRLDVFIPYVLVHLGCLGVFWTGLTRTGILVCLVSYYVRQFALGVGYHRYFAHRSFKTSRAMQFVLALVGSLCLQRGPLWWAETHRHHHRFVDTPEDIHSPKYQGFWYAHAGWFMDQKNWRTNFSKVADLEKFPELVWLDDWRCHELLQILYAASLYFLFGWEGLVWGFMVSTVLLWHSTHWIQSISHKYGGYRRYPTRDDSRNHWLLGLLTLGEFHHNHHCFPSSCRQGLAWWEVDFNYYILRAMSWLGLVWELRTPAEHTRREMVRGSESG